MALEEDDIGEEEEYGEETLQERRIRSKKRKYFFKQVYNGLVLKWIQSHLLQKVLSECVSVSTSGQVESEDDYSECGHIKDPGLLCHHREVLHPL